MYDYDVLQVLPGGRVVVSTRGLRRVALRPGDEVIAEMLPEDDAQLVADTYNEATRTQDAVVERYSPRSAEGGAL